MMFRSNLVALLLVVFVVMPGKVVADEPDVVLRELLRQAVNSNDSFDDRFEAQVWLMDMAKRLERRVPSTNHEELVTLLKVVHYEATRAGVAPELVLAVMEVESNFDRWALSVAGAQGLMQVMPFWLKEIGRPGDNLFHMETNIRMGVTILDYYLEMENGDLVRGLGRYNGSLGKMKYPNKVLKSLQRRWYRQ